MNAMPWAAPGRAAETPESSAETSRGCLTGVALDDVRRLRLPPSVGPFGRLRPPLDHTALELSLELAYLTYTLDLEPWMRAGWTDVSIQVDNRLQSGVTVGESESAGSERLHGMINAWKVTRARMALKEYNPVSQIMSALRQREKSDTIKAVTMLHPAGEGRYTVAIGFMGTGSRFYDWFSNFRFTAEDGFHKGFRQLTESFEQSAGRVLFPATAAELGLEKLTLEQILNEMRSRDSRFSLWMAGHSQGGAVMQVFCHRLLNAWGVLPRHIVGYGFASPTASVGFAGRDPAAYPLFHILNTDDLVPRMGALQHLGLCLQYQANDELRSATYGWSDDPADAEPRQKAEALMRHIADTPTMLETLAAFCETVAEEKTEDAFATLMEKRWSIAPLDKAFSFAGGKAKESLLRVARYARVAYRSVTGYRMGEGIVAQLREQMRPTVAAYPLRKLLGALRERFYPPHMLCREHRMTGAYGYIVRHGSTLLQPFVWQDTADGLPQRLFSGDFAVFTPEATGGRAASWRRLVPLRQAAHYSARMLGIGALRARRATAGCGHPTPARKAAREALNAPLLPARQRMSVFRRRSHPAKRIAAVKSKA